MEITRNNIEIIRNNMEIIRNNMEITLISATTSESPSPAASTTTVPSPTTTCQPAMTTVPSFEDITVMDTVDPDVTTTDSIGSHPHLNFPPFLKTLKLFHF